MSFPHLRSFVVLGFFVLFSALIPTAHALAAAGDTKVIVRNEVGEPIIDATVEVTCDSLVFATLGITSATGSVMGDPTAGTTCVDGSGLRFRVSSSTFDTQFYPNVGYTQLPFYTSIDPEDASSTIRGSTNVFTFGVETTGTYTVKFWNAAGDASVLPFPTGVPNAVTTTNILTYNWGDTTSPYAGINATDWFVEASKTATFATGWYQFDAASDDGIQIYLDGTKILDSYILQPLPSHPYIKRLFVTGGAHSIVIKFYEHEGYAALYSTFYPIDPPTVPLVTVVTPVDPTTNYRIQPSLAIHSDTAGSLSFTDGCTTTAPISIGVGTSTVSLDRLGTGTYGSCTATVTDPDTLYTGSAAVPSFTIIAPIVHHLGSCDNLRAIDDTANYYADDFILDNDLDCGDSDFTPLFWSASPFIGIFDGAGYTISNLTIDVPFSQFAGLFQQIDTATVENLHLSGTGVSGMRYIGAIAGRATNSTLTNITSDLPVSASFFFGGFGSGGLIGYAAINTSTPLTWSNLTVHSDVTGTLTAAGLVGQLFISGGDLTIDHAHATGTVGPSIPGFDLSYSGGLLGNVALYTATTTLTITNSSAAVDVEMNNGSSAGGFIGYLNPQTYAPISISISDSSSTGNVHGQSSLGGFLGNIDVTDGGSSLQLTFTRNSASGTVTGDGTNIGGFVGRISDPSTGAVQSSIDFSYSSASGDVTGDSSVGGFLGGMTTSGVGLHLNNANGTGGLTIYNSSASGNVTGNILGGTSPGAGGFAGGLSCQSDNPTQFAACALRKNSSTGNVSGYSYVGGFLGQLDGDATVEDSYSTGNVSGLLNVGGFIGNIDSEFSYTNVSRVYASSTITLPIGIAPSKVGGLIGSVESANNNTNIEHAFTVATITDMAGTATRVGRVIGDLQGATPAGLFHRVASSVSANCIGSSSDESACTAVSDPAVFFSSVNGPLTDWNFLTVWAEHIATYPTLTSNAVSLDISAPIISLEYVIPEGSSAVTTWHTNKRSSSKAVYSLDDSFSLSSTVIDTAPRVENHSVTLSGLLTCKTYRLKVVSTDQYGTVATSGALTFTTTGCGGGAHSIGVGTGSGGGGGSSGGSIVRTLAELIRTTVSSLFANGSTSTPATAISSSPSTSSVSEGTNTGISSSSGAVQRVCYTYTYTKDLKQGLSSPDIKTLQVFLNTHGTPVAASGPGSRGNETSFFGNGVKRALLSFQKKNALPTDGLFASTTRSFIQAQTATTTCPTVTVFQRTLKTGATGRDVQTLQRFLNTHDFPLASSGPGSRNNETQFFGPAAKRALQLFQKANALGVTGEADTATRALLNKLIAP